MQFHDYQTCRPREAKGLSADYIKSLFLSPREGGHSAAGFGNAIRGLFEYSWLTHERPFYNVHPIAIELCAKTQMTMTWGDILLPTKNLLLRFPCGHEPLGLACALARAPSSQSLSSPTQIHESWKSEFAYASSIPLGAVMQGLRDGERETRIWGYDPRDGQGRSLRGEVIKDTLIDRSPTARHTSNDEEFGQRADFLVRLLAFIGLLARGTDLITPVILSSDREEYDATTDEARKRWLEERAARRQGRGFDIGRSLELERASSPHWRSPHLALFHIGPGRTVPVLKVRSGCVVIPRDMSEVPTGYLGDEKPGEQPAQNSITYRITIPRGLRFRVMRRDGYKCRLCGLSREDGVKMHVDHIIPVAKGGKTIEPNLWLLCQPCNSGKSDSDLHLTTTAK